MVPLPSLYKNKAYPSGVQPWYQPVGSVVGNSAIFILRTTNLILIKQETLAMSALL